MNSIRDMHPLSDFQANSLDFVHQLKATGEPLMLTVDGKAELIVQDAAAYQKLIDLVEEVRAVEAIRLGLADRGAGRTISLDEFKTHVRRKHGLGG